MSDILPPGAKRLLQIRFFLKNHYFCKHDFQEYLEKIHKHMGETAKNLDLELFQPQSNLHVAPERHEDLNQKDGEMLQH